MKDVAKVKGLIADLERELIGAETDRQQKKITEKIQGYRQVVMYLSTDPSEDSVRGQLNKLEKRKLALDSGFSPSLAALQGLDTHAKQLSKYRSIHDYKGLNRQIEMLKFILD